MQKAGFLEPRRVRPRLDLDGLWTMGERARAHDPGRSFAGGRLGNREDCDAGRYQAHPRIQLFPVGRIRGTVHRLVIDLSEPAE
jgi:hypothetical protein